MWCAICISSLGDVFVEGEGESSSLWECEQQFEHVPHERLHSLSPLFVAQGQDSDCLRIRVPHACLMSLKHIVVGLALKPLSACCSVFVLLRYRGPKYGMTTMSLWITDASLGLYWETWIGRGILSRPRLTYIKEIGPQPELVVWLPETIT